MENRVSVEEEKRRLRQELRERLKRLGAEEGRRKSERIQAKLLRHPQFKGSRSVLVYVASESEVQTDSILERAKEKGKRIYLPRIDSEKEILQMIEMREGETLRPNPYGILEPPFERSRLGDPLSLDLAIVPGLGFNAKGFRLGRGKGYFDKFLSQAKQAYKIGLAFECQIMEEIPHEESDVVLDEILIG